MSSGVRSMKFFENENFHALGDAFPWLSGLLSLQVLSDILISSSFFMIPLALIYLARKRKDLALGRVLYSFAVSLFLCALTHVLSIVTVFQPIYPLHILMKLFSALSGVIAAFVLLRSMPELLANPSKERFENAEREWKTAKEEAESANHAKSAFLANMSHEIRTPLGVILGLTDLIAANEIEADEWAEYTLAIRRNGELLLKIINDILDISKVEAGRLELDNVETDVHELIEDLHTLLQFKADEKRLLFDVEAAEDLPPYILIDSLRLKQILFNIVGNALKFTDEGSVKLVVRRDTSANCLLFDIHDTGPGLTSAQMERLFKPFTQAEASTTRKFGGSGLGLALSRQLALAMGGDLRISETAPGVGTVFTLSLPIVPVSPKVARDRRHELSIASNDVSLEGLKVLVVDDSPDNLMLVSRILKKAGANVTTCEGGLKALELIASEAFHVVLMDLQMPDMDGYRVTEILRKRGFAKPIFALTAHAFKEERIRCLQSGFDGHLIKPVDKDQLVRVLNSMAHRIHSDSARPRTMRTYRGASSQSRPTL